MMLSTSVALWLAVHFPNYSHFSSGQVPLLIRQRGNDLNWCQSSSRLHHCLLGLRDPEGLGTIQASSQLMQLDLGCFL